VTDERAKTSAPFFLQSAPKSQWRRARWNHHSLFPIFLGDRGWKHGQGARSR
jgi:hypothetical protein